MNPFDRVIGYEVIKKELERTADALRNHEVYDALGVKAPRGILLFGEPGVGKSLMAECLIEASGRESITLRREQNERQFILTIRDVFREAKELAPSVVFLDDLDKFSDADEFKQYEEAFVAVQAGIDHVKHADVFVIATVNDMHILPDSLIRPGRFDRTIEVQAPARDEAVDIIRHYLSGKTLAEDVDVECLTDLLSGRSCAHLEAAVNKAGLLAGYERADCINMQHLLAGCMSVIHDISPDSIFADGQEDNPKLRLIACHEAGHAMVSEAFFPGSVAVACIFRAGNSYRGFVDYTPAEDLCMEDELVWVTRTLAGKAAVEVMYGIEDAGAADDLRKARQIVQDMIILKGYSGMSLLESPIPDSGVLLRTQEQEAGRILEREYQRAKRILIENRPLLRIMACRLLEKGILSGREVRELAEGVRHDKSQGTGDPEAVQRRRTQAQPEGYTEVSGIGLWHYAGTEIGPENHPVTD